LDNDNNKKEFFIMKRKESIIPDDSPIYDEVIETRG